MSMEIKKETVKPEVARMEPTYAGLRYVPQVDILEDGEKLVVFADLPGVDPKDVDIQFENGVLAILGKAAPRQPEDTPFLLREYGVGDFYRTFNVSETIDAERISAEYADGRLTLHLPKVEAVKPRKIEVKAR
jgi:HSP20 family protein